MKTYLYTLMLFCFSLLSVTVVNAEQSVHFSSEIIVLKTFPKALDNAAISPDGNFVFTNVDRIEVEDATGAIMVLDNIPTLWDLREFRNEMGVVKVNPWKTFDNWSKAANGFSPNNKYLGMKTSAELQIFTLPDMQLLQSIPANLSYDIASDYLSWSPDSRFLASWIDGAVIVWNVEKNIVYRYPLNYKMATIKYIENGWFIQTMDRYFFDSRSIDAFIICRVQLEKCDTYEQPNDVETITVSPNGQTILITKADRKSTSITRSLEIWQHGSDDIYRQTTKQPLDPKPYNSPTCFYPSLFSRDSQYIVSLCGYANIWQLGQKTPLQSIPDTERLVWLPNNEYFITLDWSTLLTLRLFKVGTTQPIDTLNLKTVLGLEDINSWLIGFNKAPELIINQKGNNLLFNLGFAALVIPIEYQ